MNDETQNTDHEAATQRRRRQRAALRRLRPLGQPRHRPGADLVAADPGRGDGRASATASRTARTDARGGLDRRQFLRNGLVGVASVYSATQLDWSSIWEAAVAEAAEPMQKSIVCIFLNGGNDGLNTIVPVEASEFTAYRRRARTSPACSARRPGRRSARR